MVKVTKAFDGVPDGQVYPRRFEEGDEVTGDLAEVAIANGWAGNPLEPLKQAVKAAGTALSAAKKAQKGAKPEGQAAADAKVKAAEADLAAAKAALAAAK